jgi:hypothetical protein
MLTKMPMQLSDPRAKSEPCPVAKGTKVLLEKESHMASHMATMQAPREHSCEKHARNHVSETAQPKHPSPVTFQISAMSDDDRSGDDESDYIFSTPEGHNLACRVL